MVQRRTGAQCVGTIGVSRARASPAGVSILIGDRAEDHTV